ncbi:MAG TPA: DUF1015 domain-containing protein, partial [Acidimicrobiia bacterium]|nr:DUF1015 domain-containing protein [Acidimicrobiia bacterium]
VPFPALRFATGGDLSAVTCPPYDVIEPEDRAALVAADPHNAVRLILPDRYEDADRTFRAWRADGTVLADRTPTFSLYRMHFTDHTDRPRVTTGVIGALALDRDAVLPHERTLPKAKSDRLELLRATRANFEPIWGLSLAPGLSEILRPEGSPTAVASDHGARHELFRVDDATRIADIHRLVSGARLVLADGHHRFETACAYRDERGPVDRGAASIMMLVVELAPDELCVRAIHRLLTGVGDASIRDALAGAFTVRDLGANDPDRLAALEAAMAREGALGLVDAAGLALLVPTAELATRMTALPEPLRDVDAARFAAGVLPALPGASLAYRDDAAAVAAAVAKGNAEAAVLLRPVGVDAIRAAADAGVRMPEKTTFFAPKPRTGMVFRDLDA